VIYKQKAAGYKQKLKYELDEFKKKALQEERENCVRMNQQLEVDLTES
jgi:hypothetical protein